MSSAEVTPPHIKPAPGSHLKPILMVVGCTMFAAAAQLLLKFGVAAMPQFHGDVLAFLVALLHDTPFIGGFSLHACNALLLIFALREGELSILYPVYALSYVWVALLSLHFLGEPLNLGKLAGIALIICGVGVLGKVTTR